MKRKYVRLANLAAVVVSAVAVLVEAVLVEAVLVEAVGRTAGKARRAPPRRLVLKVGAYHISFS